MIGAIEAKWCTLLGDQSNFEPCGLVVAAMAEERVTDRRFGFAKLVEGLLVQRRIMSDRREVVAQPFFVFDANAA